MTSSQNFLGPYRLIRMVRSGRRCNVWEAVRHNETDRVAIKVLLEAYKKDKLEIEQLRNEARVGAQMDHPSVITIFEFVSRYDLPFLVMQLFNARNLKQELRERPEFVAVNVPQYIRRCAEGLEHLHARGWIHCDVKPDNFLVDEQGNVKLIDFSIARPLKKGGGWMRLFSGRSKAQGTRSYMAPEQIRGKPLAETVDVYSFGCMLYEMLAGRPPFTAATADDLLIKHLKSQPMSLPSLNKNVSDDAAALINRMLAKDPRSRPQNMNEFLQEFSRINVYRAGKRPRLTG